MARRTLSTRGRVLAAGLSVGIAGGLAGIMAAGDHGANASSQPVAPDSRGSNTAPDPSSATPSGQSGQSGQNGDPGYNYGSGNGGSTQFSPQPHTSSGGS